MDVRERLDERGLLDLEPFIDMGRLRQADMYFALMARKIRPANIPAIMARRLGLTERRARMIATECRAIKDPFIDMRKP